jgi:hypothetical protein
MASRTIRIGMRQGFERIIRVAAKTLARQVWERGWGGLTNIRYVNSQDLFDNLDFDKEIKGTSTRISQFGIAGGFFAARASFWATKATLIQTSREDTPFFEANL